MWSEKRFELWKNGNSDEDNRVKKGLDENQRRERERQKIQ